MPVTGGERVSLSMERTCDWMSIWPLARVKLPMTT